jgi:predicted Zn-dependent protease
MTQNQPSVVFKHLLLVCVVLCGALAAGSKATAALPPIQVPDLGEPDAAPLHEELQMGEQMVGDMAQSGDHITDPVLQDYVEHIWQPLLISAQRLGFVTPDLMQRLHWQVLLVNDRSLNAFAMPGGFLGVHLGLLAQMADPDALAAVMAHETSHVAQRHIVRMLSQQQRQTPLLVGAMVLGVIASAQNKHADVGQAALVGSQAISAQTQLNFSRDMEREADRIGYAILKDAGFDVAGFGRMFDKLQQASRLQDDGAFPYLRSHPLTTDRTTDMRLRTQSGDAARDQQGTGKLQPSMSRLWASWMSARAQVLLEADPIKLQSWVQNASKPMAMPANAASWPHHSTILYSGALAAKRLKQSVLAQQLTLRLANSEILPPDMRPAAQLLQLEVAPSIGLAMQSLQASDRAQVLLAATFLLDANRSADVIDRLQRWIGAHPKDAHAWTLLAQAYSAQNQTLRSIRAQAESQAATWNLPQAQKQLQQALDLVRQWQQTGQAFSEMDAAIVQSRHREITQQQSAAR